VLSVRALSEIGTSILNSSLIVAVDDNEANSGEPIKFNGLIYIASRDYCIASTCYCIDFKQKLYIIDYKN